MEIAVVTGTSTGIGFATSLRLARHGYRVFAGMRNLGKAEPLRAAAAEARLPIEVIPLDVTSTPSVQRAFETVARFGEVYAFSPAFLAVRQGEPTMISFRNLQPDDEHDFMLVDPAGNVLMRVMLPPLQETFYVFTFHREGLFTFYCTMHQPDMSGQILVLAPKRG